MFFKKKQPEVSIEWLIYAVNTMYRNLYLAPKPDGVSWTWNNQAKLLTAADTVYNKLQQLRNEAVRLADKRVERKFRRTAWRFLDEYSPAC